MITGTNSRTSNNSEGGKYMPFTGLGVAKVLAVNPSNELYEKITGRAIPYELTYDARKEEDGSLNFPYNFLTYNEEAGYNFIRFSVSNKVQTSQTGKTNFIDIKGCDTWA